MAGEGTLFILVGPSGAGKNTLMGAVQKHLGDLPQLATYTTRGPRGNEQEGREHHFVSVERFEQLIAENTFVEFQQVHMGKYYGTPRAPIEQARAAGHDLVADIDFLGAEAVRKAFPDHTVIIFVTPSNLDILAERIQQRSTIEADELANRLERARFELTYALQCDYLVVNDDLETAQNDLLHMVLSERKRRGWPNVAMAPLPRHVIRGCVTAIIERGTDVLVESTAQGERLLVLALDADDTQPHVALGARLETLVGQPVELELLADKRFDFVAPRYVTLTAQPPEFTLYYYYRCFWPQNAVSEPEGWYWRAAAGLDLPRDVRQHVLP